MELIKDLHKMDLIQNKMQNRNGKVRIGDNKSNCIFKEYKEAESGL